MIPLRHKIEAQNPGERNIIFAAGADNREIWLNLRIFVNPQHWAPDWRAAYVHRKQ